MKYPNKLGPLEDVELLFPQLQEGRLGSHPLHVNGGDLTPRDRPAKYLRDN